MTAPAVAEPPFESVSVREVSRHYGRRRALWRASLHCSAGTITGLFGPNGAGKSTLIGVIATLIQANAGTITYGSRSADEWGDALRSHIGLLGHDLFLYGDLTAAENLRFFARLYGVRDLEGAVSTALDEARLSERAGDRVAAFSRGLRQRVALERALIHTPRLVLLDEPFTGLDDASAALLVARIRRLRDRGAIVVMATHDFDLAESLVDEAVCVADGRLTPLLADPGASLRERYRQAIEAAR